MPTESVNRGLLSAVEGNQWRSRALPARKGPAYRAACVPRGGMVLPAVLDFLEEYAMKKLILIAAVAAGGFMFAPAAISTSAEAQAVTVRVGQPGYRAPVHRRVVVSGPRCRMVTTRVHRHGRTVVTKTRRCY